MQATDGLGADHPGPREVDPGALVERHPGERGEAAGETAGEDGHPLGVVEGEAVAGVRQQDEPGHDPHARSVDLRVGEALRRAVVEQHDPRRERHRAGRPGDDGHRSARRGRPRRGQPEEPQRPVQHAHVAAGDEQAAGALEERRDRVEFTADGRPLGRSLVLVELVEQGGDAGVVTIVEAGDVGDRVLDLGLAHGRRRLGGEGLHHFDRGVHPHPVHPGEAVPDEAAAAPGGGEVAVALEDAFGAGEEIEGYERPAIGLEVACEFVEFGLPLLPAAAHHRDRAFDPEVVEDAAHGRPVPLRSEQHHPSLAGGPLGFGAVGIGAGRRGRERRGFGAGGHTAKVAIGPRPPASFPIHGAAGDSAGQVAPKVPAPNVPPLAEPPVPSARNVVFVEPAFPQNQRRFVRGLALAGASVATIGETPGAALDPDLREWIEAHEQVPSVCHEPSMLEAVRRLQGRAWVDRLEATVEAHVMPVATVREAASIPGTSVRTAWLCRDKPSMKEALREAGVPCAQSAAVSSRAEAHAFAERAGYPIIIKPRSGAGAEGTRRIDSAAELDRAVADFGVDRGASVALESFIEGHEGFLDAIAIDGELHLEFVSHYHPGVLEAMRRREVSPIVVTTNRVEHPVHDEVRRMARRVVQALGIGTSAVHMEWFFGPRGLAFSEIGCRPPGVSVWDLYEAANEMDLYRAWGEAIVHGRIAQRPSRRFAAGMVALRPDRDGTIARIDGCDEVERAFGDWIIDAHLPRPGTPTGPVEAGYMANGWVRMRHPDDAQLRTMLEAVGRTVKLRAMPG